MANLILIIGETGSGKSKSTKNLKPEETYYIKAVKKDLPYPEGRRSYSLEKKNMALTANYAEIKGILSAINTKRTEIKNIIIDDAGFIMTKEFFERSAEAGFAKFSDIGKHMQEILSQCEDMREDLNIAIIFHSEDVSSDNAIIKKKAKTIGNLLDDKYDPISLVTTCLFTDVTIENDDPKYEFITNRTSSKGVNIPAKSPEGMFEKRIPNDLKFVFDRIREYYS